MKTNKFRSALLLLVAALTLAGCGKDNASGKGNNLNNTTFNTSNASGEAGNLTTAEELKTAVVTGKFSEASSSNIYYFQKETGSVSDYCWNGEYRGNFDEKYGARALYNDNSIVRNITINRGGCSLSLNFDEDVFSGNSLQGLANDIVAKINSALNVHDPVNNSTVRKLLSNGYVTYFPASYTCQVWENACSYSKSVSSKVWEIKINGEWLRIDLNYALIKQPVFRRQ